MNIENVKCESCGAPLEILPGLSVIKCKSCDSVYRIRENPPLTPQGSPLPVQIGDSPISVKYTIEKVESGECIVDYDANSDERLLYISQMITSSFVRRFQRMYTLTVNGLVGKLEAYIYKGFLKLKRAYNAKVDYELKNDSKETAKVFEKCGLNNIRETIDSGGYDSISFSEFSNRNKDWYGVVHGQSYHRLYRCTGNRNIDPYTDIEIPYELEQMIVRLKNNDVVADLGKRIASNYMTDKQKYRSNYDGSPCSVKIESLRINITTGGVNLFFNGDPGGSLNYAYSALRKNFSFHSFGMEELNEKIIYAFAAAIVDTVILNLGNDSQNNYTYELSRIWHRKAYETCAGEDTYAFPESINIEFSIRNTLVVDKQYKEW